MGPLKNRCAILISTSRKMWARLQLCLLGLSRNVCIKPVLCWLLATSGFMYLPLRIGAQNKQTTGLQRPRRLDDGITWKRDPATGELTVILSGAGQDTNLPDGAANSHSISVVTQVVPVTCSVVGADG